MRSVTLAALLGATVALGACGADDRDPPWLSRADRSAYPDGPYGLEDGDTSANYSFVTLDGSTDLQALREDRRDRLLVLFGVQTWPNACAAEAEYVSDAHEDWTRRGIDVFGVLVEDFETEPTADGARSYFEIRHDASYRYGADDPRGAPSLGADLAARGLDASPVNLVVDLDTMRIQAAMVGWSADWLESQLYFTF